MACEPLPDAWPSREEGREEPRPWFGTRSRDFVNARDAQMAGDFLGIWGSKSHSYYVLLWLQLWL